MNQTFERIRDANKNRIHINQFKTNVHEYLSPRRIHIRECFEDTSTS